MKRQPALPVAGEGGPLSTAPSVSPFRFARLTLKTHLLVGAPGPSGRANGLSISYGVTFPSTQVALLHCEAS